MSEVLRVTKGQPDDDELAALVIALGLVRAREPQPATAESTSAWRARPRSGARPRGATGWAGAPRR